MATADRDTIWKHLKEVYDVDDGKTSAWTGSLYRFARECRKGDYVLYYDPENKKVMICRVISDLLYRTFDLAAKDLVGEEVDVWYHRKVQYPVGPIPVLDFYGALKGKLLGPRIAFWEISDAFDIVDSLANGVAPHFTVASDPEIRSAFDHLCSLVVKRAAALNECDWEWLVVDFLKAQGAHVDERRVGGSRAVIDIEARFDLGLLGESTWRVQVKRLEGKQIDWPDVERLKRHGGDAELCYVSVFGFTAEARRNAAGDGIRLLEAGDFTAFLLSGKLRDDISRKLRLPIGSKNAQA